MVKGHQGHESKAAWNVALWIGNDEGLYNLARHYIRICPNKDIAARRLLDDLTSAGTTHTPDGFKYTRNTVRLALRGL